MRSDQESVASRRRLGTNENAWFMLEFEYFYGCSVCRRESESDQNMKISRSGKSDLERRGWRVQISGSSQPNSHHLAIVESAPSL